jgi:alkanesulfonate monooxygenase SsuD/methylene tetrahydromethanopterin reductase-like flavin-dependent oxidoreductase (luciferase family)
VSLPDEASALSVVFITKGDQVAPLIALMAAANAIRTLRVGSLVLDNDYRHPAMLAKEAATLDVLSSGRFEPGLGAGWPKERLTVRWDLVRDWAFNSPDSYEMDVR